MYTYIYMHMAVWSLQAAGESYQKKQISYYIIKKISTTTCDYLFTTVYILFLQPL